MNTKNEIFISYCHANKKWLNKVKVAIKPLMRNQIINEWDDTKILPGQDWKFEINKALEKSNIAILLVTPEFLASDFIMNDELPYFLEKKAKNELTILWLLISPCLHELTDLSKIQCVNSPSSPLDELTQSTQNEVFVKLSKTIMALNAMSQNY
jgi:internalin A